MCFRKPLVLRATNQTEICSCRVPIIFVAVSIWVDQCSSLALAIAADRLYGSCGTSFSSSPLMRGYRVEAPQERPASSRQLLQGSRLLTPCPDYQQPTELCSTSSCPLRRRQTRSK